MCKQIKKEKQSRRLQAYLKLKGWDRKTIALILDVSLPRASAIICSGVATQEQRELLQQSGFPEMVLPLASRGKTGPIRKIELPAAS